MHGMHAVDEGSEAVTALLGCDKARAVAHGTLFQQAPVGMARTSTEGRILDANAQLCAMLGYAAEELCRLSTRDLTHPDDRDRHDHLRRQLVERKISSYCAQKRFARKDGRWLWVERYVTLARDAANEPPYLIQVFQDVTERKRTEAQLERLRRARDLLARCNRALMHASVESDLLQEVCRIAVEAGGFKQAWIGLATGESKRCLAVAACAGYEDHRPPMSSSAMWTADGRYRGKMAEVVRTGTLRIERDVLNEDRDHFQRAHARRFGWGSSAAFPLAADGRILGAIEFNAREVDAFDGDEIALLGELAADLSFGIGALRMRLARAQAEAQIHAQERRYQETFDKAPVGIMHTAFEDNQILRANRRLSEMLGYTEAELLQLKSTDLVHPSMRGNDGPRYRQRLVDGDSETHASERLYLHKQGWTLWVNRTVSLVKDAAGKPDYYIRIIEDISDRILSVRRRAMEHAVAKTLAEATSVEEAMPALIRTMCEASDWCYGAHWCWSNAERKLVRSASWSDCEMQFADAEEERRWVRLYLRNRSGLVGGAWHECRPQWIEDMRVNTAFQRRVTALRLGFYSALSFPIIAGAETIGIMEFFAREVRKPDEVLLQTVGSIGRQIGQFIQRKHAEQALRTSEERYRDIFEASPLPMWVRDDRTRAIITVNQAAIDHYGYSREEFLGMTVRDLWDPAEQATYEENGRSSPDMQILHLKRRHRTKDGRVRDVEATARAFELSGRRVWLTLINDVTERVRTEQKLVHLAHYDPLTGLPNRVLFYERLKQALKLGARNRWSTAVMFMDIDRFKNINDTLGHDVGDQLLREVSQRLAASVRASDTVGRLGGDEFAVVLSNVAAREDVGRVAQKIMQNFHEPFRLSGSEIFVTTSIGITIAPHDGAEQEVLLKNADSAMYKAKEEGRNTFRYYTPEMSARALRLLTLEGSLRRALERNEFLLHYQPKACVASGAVTGVEALLRWRHPQRGLVPPGEFIPVLEETGLIVQTAEWVLNAVCNQLVQWHANGIPRVPVAVNLSAREFLAPDLGRTIKRILEAHAVPPSALELEITESSLMVNPQEAARTLEYLKQLGVGLAIDDFGTGYSSLSYLKRFPLDALKIDRSFVRDITANANDAAITLAIISMAHSLGLEVVAEGVEDAAQLAFLAQHGCDQVQGFFLARPLDALECAPILQAGRLGGAGD